MSFLINTFFFSFNKHHTHSTIDCSSLLPIAHFPCFVLVSHGQHYEFSNPISPIHEHAATNPLGAVFSLSTPDPHVVE